MVQDTIPGTAANRKTTALTARETLTCLPSRLDKARSPLSSNNSHFRAKFSKGNKDNTQLARSRYLETRKAKRRATKTVTRTRALRIKTKASYPTPSSRCLPRLSNSSSNSSTLPSRSQLKGQKCLHRTLTKETLICLLLSI